MRLFTKKNISNSNKRGGQQQRQTLIEFSSFVDLPLLHSFISSHRFSLLFPLLSQFATTQEALIILLFSVCLSKQQTNTHTLTLLGSSRRHYCLTYWQKSTEEEKVHQHYHFVHVHCFTGTQTDWSCTRIAGAPDFEVQLHHHHHQQTLSTNEFSPPLIKLNYHLWTEREAIEISLPPPP